MDTFPADVSLMAFVRIDNDTHCLFRGVSSAASSKQMNLTGDSSEKEISLKMNSKGSLRELASLYFVKSTSLKLFAALIWLSFLLSLFIHFIKRLLYNAFNPFRFCLDLKKQISFKVNWR
jgi:hypothetical protein